MWQIDAVMLAFVVSRSWARGGSYEDCSLRVQPLIYGIKPTAAPFQALRQPMRVLKRGFLSRLTKNKLNSSHGLIAISTGCKELLRSADNEFAAK